MKMVLRFDGREYTADTAIQLIDIIKPIRWNAHLLPTHESYISEMVRTYKQVTRRRLRLPKGNTETRARAMFKLLAEIGVWEFIEEE